MKRFSYYFCFLLVKQLIDNQASWHINNVDENLSPKTWECEKEGINWVALRMCLSCGHVGCSDSSVGLHATKDFQKTRLPVLIALPKKSWKWCYVDKNYLR
jgi:uncharacterized UBP type Zn finger protein